MLYCSFLNHVANIKKKHAKPFFKFCSFDCYQQARKTKRWSILQKTQWNILVLYIYIYIGLRASMYVRFSEIKIV